MVCLCCGCFLKLRVFWGWVVFELLGVGGDFVLRWGLALGCVLFVLICGDRVLCWGEFFGVRVGAVFELWEQVEILF